MLVISIKSDDCSCIVKHSSAFLASSCAFFVSRTFKILKDWALLTDNEDLENVGRILIKSSVLCESCGALNKIEVSVTKLIRLYWAQKRGARKIFPLTERSMDELVKGFCYVWLRVKRSLLGLLQNVRSWTSLDMMTARKLMLEKYLELRISETHDSSTLVFFEKFECDGWTTTIKANLRDGNHR